MTSASRIRTLINYQKDTGGCGPISVLNDLRPFTNSDSTISFTDLSCSLMVDSYRKK